MVHLRTPKKCICRGERYWPNYALWALFYYYLQHYKEDAFIYCDILPGMYKPTEEAREGGNLK